MATSGSRSFSLNRNELIRRAFQMINVYALNDTVSADDLSYASDALNGMIKMWQAEGIQLWNRRQATLFTAYQDKQYSLGLTGDHATNSYVSTTLSAAEASGQTILSVTSSTGMTASDYVGIELDDGTRQWTTISTVDSSTQITVADALTDDAASGATVVAYTTKIDRPLRILRATTIDLNNSDEVTMQLLSYDEYFNLPIKTSDGRPVNFYYDKLLTTGQLYLYPRPDNVDIAINFTYHESLEDLTAATDDPDFPQEWAWVLVTCLAVELAYAYGKYTELERLEPKAERMKEQAKWFDSDEAVLRFGLE